jgi:hypothetical protein
VRQEFHTDLQRLDAEVVVAGRDAQRAVQGTARLLDAYSPDDPGSTSCSMTTSAADSRITSTVFLADL